MNEEEVQALVIDTGSITLKAGFAGDDAPRTLVPNVVGSLKNASIQLGGMEERDTFVGEEAVAKRDALFLSYPLEGGNITNWNDMEKVWHHTFYSALRIKPNEHPVLLTEAPLNPKANRERMTKIMFETFNVRSLCVASKAVLSLFSSGLTTGCVVDSGSSVTEIVPVYDGKVVPHAVKSYPLAGSDFTSYLMKILGERGYCFTGSNDDDDELIRDMKEKLCYVALDFEEEMQKSIMNSSAVETTYTSTGGSTMAVGNERFRCPESLFNPTLIAKTTDGIASVISKSIMACDASMQKSLFGNILLAGGSSMIDGLSERMHKEVAALTSSFEVKVVAPSERKYSAWLGGSIVASASPFQGMWISKEEYEKGGASIVHDRCI